jgi:hypothetical protein
MIDSIDPDVALVAEEHRQVLDEEFFSVSNYIELSLSNGKFPESLRFRDGAHDGKTLALVEATMKELRLLLCTNDKKYDEVRQQGSSFSKLALTAMAGYVAHACSISLGVATGGVAFLALAVFRVGVGVFCQLSSNQVPGDGAAS